ncbi:COQ9-domain-containing protein [Lineolata rhizophorae]|uniref:Ubiquinone biosynthesis protein n=1 Tax=Lineolata rhizophorae TaxID=578093 RepID=A0A6A6NUF2_9PEZI|nr:COQ9-domain-containing protein [Lineolata rhizophorae]
MRKNQIFPNAFLHSSANRVYFVFHACPSPATPSPPQRYPHPPYNIPIAPSNPPGQSLRSNCSNYYSNHLEGTVLSAALTHVPALGFSDAALRAGARDAGYTDATASSMFLPGEGAWELVRWHLVSSREGLGAAWRESWEALEEKEDMAEEQRHKVLKARARQLVVERLRMNTRAGLVARMSEALAIMAQPSHVPAALRELAWLADEFCFLAGDTAVDGSWYAKRGALATVYAAAEMFQMQDGSVEQLDTERFVGDRLDEVETLRKRVDGVGEWLGYTGWSVVNGLRSKGVRI